MKCKLLGLSLIALSMIAASSCSETTSSERAATNAANKSRQSRSNADGAGQPDAAHVKVAPQGPVASSDAAAKDEHGHDHSSDRVPAFQMDAASLNSLPPTLSPALFKGKQQLAYEAVRQIPKTIAQLPCYCYCDQGFGHKSLHSCFVDDHAAHCAVCVDEALLAFRLQKEDGLTPAQIRARVIAEYGSE